MHLKYTVLLNGSIKFVPQKGSTDWGNFHTHKHMTVYLYCGQKRDAHLGH